MRKTFTIPSVLAGLVGLLSVLISAKSYAQESDSVSISPISTYRPSISIGSGVVPKGTVQVEAGLRYNKDTPGDKEITSHAYPNLLVRVGVLKRLELQLSGVVQDSVVREPQGHRKVQGVGPIGVGFALSLSEEQHHLPALALNGNLALPVGDDRLTPTHAEPAVLLAASKSVTNWMGLLVNAGYSWSGGTPTSTLVLNLNSDLKGPFSLYLEAARDKTKGQEAAYRANAGLMWRAMHNLQFDVAAGKQLNSLATDYFFATGVAFRLPK